MNDHTIRTLAALFAESDRLDEAWIATTAARLMMTPACVKERHDEMIRIAQGSQFTIREIERMVDLRLERGLALAPAIRAVRSAVARAPKVARKGVRR